MVQYVKKHKDIQAIIVVFNFNQDRFAPYLKTMIKIFNDIFKVDDFWFHVGFVFTKYYKGMRSKFEKKKDKKLDKYIGEIQKLVEECKRKLPLNFNTYFIDSDMDDMDPESIEECKRLLGWVASLEPLDTSQIKDEDKIDDKIKESESIINEIEGPSRWEKNIEFKTIITMEKIKNTYYDGTITYSEEKEIKREEKKIEHEKEIVNTRFEEKEEQESKWEGKKEIITTKFERRKIITYNDGTVEEGNWEEYKTAKVDIIEHPKILKNIKDEHRDFEKDGYKIIESRKIRIFDDGSIEEGEWEIISKNEIQKFEPGRKIEKIEKETKVEEVDDIEVVTEQKSFQTGYIFKDTHYYDSQKVIPKKKKIKQERTVIYYKDGFTNYGEWRRID